MSNSNRKSTPHPMPDQEILNIDDAAAFLGVSVKTFSKVLREGDVPGRKVGREWKFSRRALVDWIGESRSRNFLDGADARPTAPDRRRRNEVPASARATKNRRAERSSGGFSVDDLK